MIRRAALLFLLSSPLVAAAFVERASESGLDFRHFNGMSGQFYYVEMMGAGVGMLDYDQDGDLDVYLVQGRMLGERRTLDDAFFEIPPELPLRDRLFRNEGDSRGLRFVDVTATSGLDARGYGMGLATGDFDRDGNVDLYVTNFGSNQLWRNRGDGTFEDVTVRAGVDDNRWSVSATFFDYDRDGWLDLFVANYVAFATSENKFCPAPSGGQDYCGPKAFRPVSDRLWRNRGDGTFEDVTATALRGKAAVSYGMGVVSDDFNDDLWPDLYVTSDARPNLLFLNQGDGTLLEDGELSGCSVNMSGKAEGSMGIWSDDLDGNGHVDLFVTHLVRETHTLYDNSGDAIFLDATLGSGLARSSLPRTGFGTAALDYDNDGRLDLMVANGGVTIHTHPDYLSVPHADPEADRFVLLLHEPNQLFRQVEGRFVEVDEEGLQHSEVSRGLAVGDLDNDGDADVLISNNHGPARLLINQAGQDGQFLGVRVTDGSGADLLGTRVELVGPGGRKTLRRVHSDGSYLSAHDPRLLFGGSFSPRGSELIVLAPDGSRRILKGIPEGRYSVVVLANQGPAR